MLQRAASHMVEMTIAEIDQLLSLFLYGCAERFLRRNARRGSRPVDCSTIATWLAQPRQTLVLVDGELWTELSPHDHIPTRNRDGARRAWLRLHPPCANRSAKHGGLLAYLLFPSRSSGNRFITYEYSWQLSWAKRARWQFRIEFIFPTRVTAVLPGGSEFQGGSQRKKKCRKNSVANGVAG